MNLSTLSVRQFKDLLVKTAYYPHPSIATGSVICSAAAGPADTDNSRIYLHPRARLDVTADIIIGQWVMIGGGAHILTHTHDFAGTEPLLLKSARDPVAFTIPLSKDIRDDVWIFSSVVLPKCRFIAKGVLIGTGSIVSKDITEPYTIWAGNPARQIGMR